MLDCDSAISLILMANVRLDVVQRRLVDALVIKVCRISFVLLKVWGSFMLVLDLLVTEHLVVHRISIAN